MTVLRYGTDSSVNLQSVAEGRLEPCDVPKGAPLSDAVAAVAAALEQPLDYPSLVRCTTPGDRVAIALGAEVPQVAAVTSAVVRTLLDAGIGRGLESRALRGAAAKAVQARGGPVRLACPRVWPERVRMRNHDPVDRRNLAYLAAFESGEPILLNRMLTDADVVLAGRLHSAGSWAKGYYGIHTTLYPEFSDTKTQARFRKHDRFSDNGHHRELRREVNHVAWLLGVNFTVQVVPAAGDEILHVLAGQSDAVRHRGHELYREAWKWPVAEPAELVIAAIEGGPVHQTWENLGRVLESAARLVDDGGAIAVCCELSAPPGPAMQRLMREPARDAGTTADSPRESARNLLPGAATCQGPGVAPSLSAQPLERRIGGRAGDDSRRVAERHLPARAAKPFVPRGGQRGAGDRPCGRRVRMYPAHSVCRWSGGTRSVPDTKMTTHIAANVATICGRIAEAARRSGRSADAVKLIAVTKYAGPDEIRALVAAGCTELGESRPQQLWERAAALGDLPVRWHMIGHLQRTKVERTLPLVTMVHSVDSVRLAEAIDGAAAALARRLPVLLEVNVSGEAAKHGFAFTEVEPLLPALLKLKNIEIRGLMCIAGLEGGDAAARRDFAALRTLRDRLQAICPAGMHLDELSMGMSGDFEIAIEEGATMVRVGSALFEAH